jgi:hypothetical protein
VQCVFSYTFRDIGDGDKYLSQEELWPRQMSFRLEYHDKNLMGLSEIDKNRIAEIWKRYLDPPSSIRKWLEEYDKKVQFKRYSNPAS